MKSVFFPRQQHQYSEIGRMLRDTDGYQQLFHTGGLCDHWKLLTLDENHLCREHWCKELCFAQVL